MPTKIESTLKLTASPNDGWIPSSSSAKVAGLNIGGMIYVEKPPMVKRSSIPQRCMAYIDPSLEASDKKYSWRGRPLLESCGYSDLGPASRLNYLKWLKSGRKDKSYHPSYMLLYFSGLERRFFCYPPKEEAAEILSEVRRLQKLYPEDYLSCHHISEFLDFAMLSEVGFEAIKPDFKGNSPYLPTELIFAIGVRFVKGESLNAEWLQNWLGCHPKGDLRIPMLRCPDKFTALFRMRFDERFPQGLELTPSKKRLQVPYTASTLEFKGMAEFRCNGKVVPDFSDKSRIIEIGQEIADDVMKELKKFSLFLVKKPAAQDSLEAWLLLPEDLRPLYPNKKAAQLKSWAAEIVKAGGLVPVSELIERMQGLTTKKNLKSQLTIMADLLGSIGFGLTPDHRLASRCPTPEQPVMLFRLGEKGKRAGNWWSAYRKVLLEISLGAYVALGKDGVVDVERNLLQAHIDSVTKLDEQIRRRLHADLVWYLAVKPDKTFTRKRIASFHNFDAIISRGLDVNLVRELMISIVRADGIIHPEQVGKLEKLYPILELDPSLIYTDLHAGGIIDDPALIQTSLPGRKGETIPSPGEAGGPGLDRSRIEAIRSDTERISSVLGQIFDTNDEQSSGAIAPCNESLVQGLDQQHNGLVLELVTRKHWPESKFAELCKSHGMMPSGALESINEWAFETCGEVLLDENNGFEVSLGVAELIRKNVLEENDVDSKTS